jgi:DNA-binding NarL/FixJ family response regulator
VLIVDDHALFADALKVLLDRDGSVHVVGVAHDGSEAVDLAVSTDAEVVLMDVGLPTVDGFEASRRLRDLKHAAKVIALTGRLDAQVRAEAAAAGMVGSLTKDHVYDTVVQAILAASGR